MRTRGSALLLNCAPSVMRYCRAIPYRRTPRPAERENEILLNGISGRITGPPPSVTASIGEGGADGGSSCQSNRPRAPRRPLLSRHPRPILVFPRAPRSRARLARRRPGLSGCRVKRTALSTLPLTLSRSAYSRRSFATKLHGVSPGIDAPVSNSAAVIRFEIDQRKQERNVV